MRMQHKRISHFISSLSSCIYFIPDFVVSVFMPAFLTLKTNFIKITKEKLYFFILVSTNFKSALSLPKINKLDSALEARAAGKSWKFMVTQSSTGLIFCYRSFIFNSNKSRTWCNNFSVYYPDVSLQLNMFRAFSRPSSGAQWLQWQSLVLPSYRGDSRVVFVVGPAGPITNTALLSPQYEGKTRGCHCSYWAPDDGRVNAWNMLSCK